MDDYVAQWLEKADKDLKVASNELALEQNNMVTEAICFHCQQAAEKYLKAYLITRGIDFDKTHNIEYLVELCAETDTDFLNLETGNLSAYAVSIRYPDNSYVPSFEEAKESYDITLNIKCLVLDKIQNNSKKEKQK